MPYRKYWAKSEREDPRLKWRPYVEHVASVALAANELLSRDPVFLSNLARLLGHSKKDTRRLVVFLAALHDLGKLSALFQWKYPAGYERTYGNQDQLSFYKDKTYKQLPDGRWSARYYHGTHGICFFGPATERHPVSENRVLLLLPQEEQKRARNLLPFLHAAGSHHGLFLDHIVEKDVSFLIGDRNDLPALGVSARDPSLLPEVKADQEAMAAFYQEAVVLFNPPAVPKLTPLHRNAATLSIAGIISVADWIGSNDEFMGLKKTWKLRTFTEAYNSRDLQRAVRRSIHSTQFHKAPTRVSPFTLIDGHAFSDLQLFVGGLSPRLLILEAPTGEGKTEAALLLVRNLMVDEKISRLIFPLPTRATANNLFDRVERFTQEVLGPDYHCALSHSSARQVLHSWGKDRPKDKPHSAIKERALSALRGCGAGLLDYALQPKETRSRHKLGWDIGDSLNDFRDEDDSSMNGWKWFQSGKRALLSPVSVTTIDQILMASTLNSKHHFVRSFAMSSSVVVIDEVHATDLYMSGLLTNLLKILAAMGARVVLLSATLSPSLRKELVDAFREGMGLPNLPVPATHSFPLISWLDDAGDFQQKTLSARRPSRRVKVKVIPHRWDPETFPRRAHRDDVVALAEDAIKSVEAGACTAWIRNTVQDTQDLYDIVAQRRPAWVKDGTLLCLNAGLANEDRGKIEDEIKARLGPGGHREPCLVVGTQILDQSVDIDFDRLIRDFTTLDYLIQVLGRCHRHENKRPKGFEYPILEVFVPETFVTPRNDIYRTVYSEVCLPLHRTYNWLQTATEVNDPADVPALIETVFSRTAPTDAALLPDYERDQKTVQRQKGHSFQASIDFGDKAHVKDSDGGFRKPTRFGIFNRPFVFLVPTATRGVFRLPYRDGVVDLRPFAPMLDKTTDDKKEIKEFLHSKDMVDGTPRWKVWMDLCERLTRNLSGRSTAKAIHKVKATSPESHGDYTYLLGLLWWADGCFPRRIVSLQLRDEDDYAHITRIQERDGKNYTKDYLTRYDKAKGLVFIPK